MGQVAPVARRGALEARVSLPGAIPRAGTRRIPAGRVNRCRKDGIDGGWHIGLDIRGFDDVNAGIRGRAHNCLPFTCSPIPSSLVHRLTLF